MLAMRRAPSSLARWSGGVRGLASGSKIACPPITYIKGEEMTAYTMELIMAKWVEPHVDTSKWEFFDLSCVSRDATEDKVLHDAVASGARLKAIFKEPTVTPTEVQKAALGLKKVGSPNGATRAAERDHDLARHDPHRRHGAWPSAPSPSATPSAASTALASRRSAPAGS